MIDPAVAAQLDQCGVPRETWPSLARFVGMVLAANRVQNLIAPSTEAMIWQRHVVDSAQLLPLAGDKEGGWLDIGSGAGFPGLVVAIACQASARRVTLVEPRALRVAFLRNAVAKLELDRVDIFAGRVERLESTDFAVISARAVAPLSELIAMARHLSTAKTRWLLPKGRKSAMELAEAQRRFRVDFQSVASVTEPKAAILVGHVFEKQRELPAAAAR